MYRVMIVVFVVCICPFAYFDIKNTKALQIITTAYRWFSMLSMIVLALIKIQNQDQNNTPNSTLAVDELSGDSMLPVSKLPTVNMFVVSKLPSFIGVALYAFMCQHSIPAVTTPVNNKNISPK